MKLTQKQIISYSVAVVLMLFALSLVLAYLTKSRDPITVFFKRLYPMSLVGDRVVSVNDFEKGVIIAQRFGVTTVEAEQSVVENEKAYALAKKLNLDIGNDALSDEMRFYTKGNESEYQNVLEKNYDGSEHWFYKYAVTPRVVDAALRMKYYSDIKTNNPKYQKAQSILDRLSKGEKFEDVAKVESEDKLTGQLGGDLGLYEAGQIIPELEDQISISAEGEIRKEIVVTRLGYHIIYPVEYSMIDGKKMWHAKHMLFVPNGYDEWFEQQIKGISVRSIK